MVPTCHSLALRCGQSCGDRYTPSRIPRPRPPPSRIPLLSRIPFISRIPLPLPLSHSRILLALYVCFGASLLFSTHATSTATPEQVHFCPTVQLDFPQPPPSTSSLAYRLARTSLRPQSMMTLCSMQLLTLGACTTYVDLGRSSERLSTRFVVSPKWIQQEFPKSTDISALANSLAHDFLGCFIPPLCKIGLMDSGHFAATSPDCISSWK